MRRNSRLNGRAGGYALFEAMIAVLVAAIGFIGAARLQTAGLKLNSSSQLRQKAVLLAYQMTDRIRANRNAARSYDRVATGSLVCLASGCTPAQLAVADMTEWSNDVAAQLRGGTGIVCIDSSAPPIDAAPACNGVGQVLVVQVAWADGLGTTRFSAQVRP